MDPRGTLSGWHEAGHWLPLGICRSVGRSCHQSHRLLYWRRRCTEALGPPPPTGLQGPACTPGSPHTSHRSGWCCPSHRSAPPDWRTPSSSHNGLSPPPTNILLEGGTRLAGSRHSSPLPPAASSSHVAGNLGFQELLRLVARRTNSDTAEPALQSRRLGPLSIAFPISCLVLFS